jgi:hypothetical protein
LGAVLNAAPQPGVGFAQPITLTIRCQPASLLGLDPATLQLLSWNGAAWSSDGIVLLSHYIPASTLTVTLSHLSDFAFFAAPAPAQLRYPYLPGVSK